VDLAAYRQSENERLRKDDLIRLLPRTGGLVLEVGSRDGYHSRILAQRFSLVVAIDLEPQPIAASQVVISKASVTALPFQDGAFDCVLCAEVLEHVPDVGVAAAEISRVARRDVLIGVPFRQDTRVGKLTCRNCGRVSPPYGHVNTFDENRLRSLFPTLSLVEFSYIGANADRTNWLSSRLMTAAGNPWGPYDQDEPCVHCGRQFVRPAPRTMPQRILSSAALRTDNVLHLFSRPAPIWIHALFRKRT
jgi:SAM-dependent methyltransferase